MGALVSFVLSLVTVGCAGEGPARRIGLRPGPDEDAGLAVDSGFDWGTGLQDDSDAGGDMIGDAGSSDPTGGKEGVPEVDAGAGEGGRPEPAKLCPDDPNKTKPGLCGCGVEDTCSLSSDKYLQLGGFEGAVCGVKEDGTVGCNGTLNAAVPANVQFREVRAAGGRACGVRRDGLTQCWGNGNSPGNTLFSTISMGDAYSCGIRQDNAQMECWDDGDYAPPPTGAVRAFSAGWVSGCVIGRDTKTASCFGSFAHSVSGTDLVSISQGRYGYCTLDANGLAACGGRQASNTSTERMLQVSVRHNRNHVCGIRASDHALLCWGGWSLPTPTGRPFREVIVYMNGYCAIIDDPGGPMDGRVQCVNTALP